MIHLMPQLPFEKDALAPFMSGSTIDYHYGKHLQAYIDNLNKLIQGTPYEDMSLEEIICKASGPIFNNAAQAWNHTFFFESLCPSKMEIPSSLRGAIENDFGSVESFKEKFLSAAASLFGSGWAWLVIDENGKLAIHAESNAGTPLVKGLTPILTIDVWEHAYYIDYQNRRPVYLQNVWEIINWEVVEERYKAALHN